MATGPEQSDTAQSEPTALDEATRLLALAEVEYEAKGYPPALSRFAVSRAQSTALYRVADVPANVRQQAYLGTLRAELQNAEKWLRGQQAFLTRLDEEGNETK